MTNEQKKQQEQAQKYAGSGRTVIRGYRMGGHHAEYVYFCILMPYNSADTKGYGLLVCEFMTFGSDGPILITKLIDESTDNVEPIMTAFHDHPEFYSPEKITLFTNTETKPMSPPIIKKNSVDDSNWRIDFGIVLAAFATIPSELQHTFTYKNLIVKLMEFIRSPGYVW